MKVNETMTKDIEFINSNSTLSKAAEKMKDLNVGDLPVVVDGDMVGMITDRDITIRAVAHGLDPKVAKVVDAMSEGVVACREDDDIETAVKLMSDYQIRRLAVKNAGGEMTGMISLGDLATRLDSNAAFEALREISK